MSPVIRVLLVSATVVLSAASLSCGPRQGSVEAARVAPSRAAPQHLPHPSATAPEAKHGAPAAASEQPGSALHTHALDTTAQREVIAELAARIDAEYIEPQAGTRWVALLRERLEQTRGEARVHPEAFAAELTRALQSSSGDGHLLVFWSAEPVPPPLGDSPPPDALERLRKATGGIRHLEILEGNVGYMKLVAVASRAASEDAIAAAFAFLHHTDALIIDNRENGGGDPRTVMLYLSYLVDRPPFVVMRKVARDGTVLEELGTTEVGGLRYGPSKPVYVLTSRQTFSAGAGMAYQLRLLGRAVIVGEVATRGTGFPHLVSLGHGVYAWIPYAKSVSALAAPGSSDGSVQPDMPVPAARALSEAQAAERERRQRAAPRSVP